MGLAEGQIEFNLSMFLGYFNILLYDSRFMKLVASKPARLHCPNCDATYSLPAGGSFKLFNELKCPLDEFELLLWVGGRTVKDIRFVLIATFIRHSGTVEFVIVHFTDLRKIPINNPHFSIEKWRKAVDVINAHIHRVLMVWMQPELPPAANVQMAFWFLILLQDPNGNWLVISKKIFSKYFLEEMIN